jgi:hypothetical protein
LVSDSEVTRSRKARFTEEHVVAIIDEANRTALDLNIIAPPVTNAVPIVSTPSAPVVTKLAAEMAKSIPIGYNAEVERRRGGVPAASPADKITPS